MLAMLLLLRVHSSGMKRCASCTPSLCWQAVILALLLPEPQAAAPPGSAGAGGEDAAGAKGSSAEQAHSSTGGAGAGTAGGAGGANAAGSNRGANQAALLQSGLLEALLPLALVMGGVSSVVVRTQSLQATGDLVSDSPKGQERLGASTVMVAKGFELPALQVRGVS